MSLGWIAEALIFMRMCPGLRVGFWRVVRVRDTVSPVFVSWRAFIVAILKVEIFGYFLRRLVL